MTDKEYKAQVKKIRNYVNKWAKPMGLGWHDIKMVWSRDYHPENSLIGAVTICSWEYRHGTITWYVPQLVESDDEELERIVVHELCHVIAWPLWDLVEEDTKKQGEMAIESIARAFLWCDNNGKLKK